MTAGGELFADWSPRGLPGRALNGSVWPGDVLSISRKDPALQPARTTDGKDDRAH